MKRNTIDYVLTTVMGIFLCGILLNLDLWIQDPDSNKDPELFLIKRQVQMLSRQLNDVKNMIKEESDALKITFINNRLISQPMLSTPIELSKIGKYLYTEQSKKSSNPLLHNQYFIEALDFYIKKYAKINNLPYTLIYAIIDMESNFDPFLVSSADCIGLMQVNYKVWKDYFKIKSKYILCDIQKNIQIGSAILKHYYDKTKNINEAIKCYFGKDNYNKIYLKKVKARWSFYKKIAN